MSAYIYPAAPLSPTLKKKGDTRDHTYLDFISFYCFFVHSIYSLGIGNGRKRTWKLRTCVRKDLEAKSCLLLPILPSVI